MENLRTLGTKLHKKRESEGYPRGLKNSNLTNSVYPREERHRKNLSTQKKARRPLMLNGI
jgi:hypothetical protein